MPLRRGSGWADPSSKPAGSNPAGAEEVPVPRPADASADRSGRPGLAEAGPEHLIPGVRTIRAHPSTRAEPRHERPARSPHARRRGNARHDPVRNHGGHPDPDLFSPKTARPARSTTGRAPRCGSAATAGWTPRRNGRTHRHGSAATADRTAVAAGAGAATADRTAAGAGASAGVEAARAPETATAPVRIPSRGKAAAAGESPATTARTVPRVQTRAPRR